MEVDLYFALARESQVTTYLVQEMHDHQLQVSLSTISTLRRLADFDDHQIGHDVAFVQPRVHRPCCGAEQPSPAPELHGSGSRLERWLRGRTRKDDRSLPEPSLMLPSKRISTLPEMVQYLYHDVIRSEQVKVLPGPCDPDGTS